MNHALIVVDMQKDLQRQKDPKYVAERVAVQKRIIDKFREKKYKILFLTLQYEGPILPELGPVGQDEIFVKRHSDGFEDADVITGKKLEDIVSSYRRLHFVGCNADICVRFTVNSAVKNGHSCIIYKNAVLSEYGDRFETDIMATRYLLNFDVRVVNYNERTPI